MNNQDQVFWIFGALQALTLGLITYFLLASSPVGWDTRATLSLLFPVFTLNVEYVIYSKK